MYKLHLIIYLFPTMDCLISFRVLNSNRNEILWSEFGFERTKNKDMKKQKKIDILLSISSCIYNESEEWKKWQSYED